MNYQNFLNASAEFGRKLEQLQKLKQEIAEEILADKSLDKTTKLNLISLHNLWKTMPWVQNIFEDLGCDLAKQIKERRGFAIPDDYILEMYEWNRGQTIWMSNVIKMISESEGDIDAVTFRGEPEKITISKEEAMEHVYNWCVKNQSIGFVFDW